MWQPSLAHPYPTGSSLPVVFSLRYVLAELRRRKGRTILTALGLAVGVGLVATVTSLSAGLDDAQDEVLAPLTGLGTDMSVNRPVRLDDDVEEVEAGPGGNLTPEEQQRLRDENGGGNRLDFSELGEPGESFEVERYVAAAQLSFPATEADAVAALPEVTEVAPALSLNLVRVSGEVPEATQRGGAGALGGGFEFDNATIAGVDRGAPDLGLVTPVQVVTGGYFAAGAEGRRQIILNEAYAGRENLDVGDTLPFADDPFTVVGLAETPLGGQASDIYMPLGELQRLSDRRGRTNLLLVRAEDGADVAAVAEDIEAAFPDSRVTTAADVADRVEGTLVDADNISRTLGLALALVAMAAAVGIAILLTLGSVAKRTRELGTLRAVGWPRRMVVRQVAGESVVTGLIGGVVGAGVGIAGALIITAIGPELSASVPVANEGFGFGRGATEAVAEESAVTLSAPINLALIMLAIGLAILGGLIAGVVGGLRAARLQPAEAFRHID